MNRGVFLAASGFVVVVFCTVMMSDQVASAHLDTQAEAAAEAKQATLLKEQRRNEYVKNVLERVSNNFEPCITKERIDSLPIISFDVDPVAAVSHIQIDLSSGSLSTDLTCLDAILTTSPLPRLPVEAPIKVKCDFNILSKSSALQEYECLREPENKDSVEVHTIPIAVLRLYPGQYKEQEIHSQLNVLRIPSADAQDRLICIRSRWTYFFMRHDLATRKEIEDYRGKVIDYSNHWTESDVNAGGCSHD